MKYQQLLSRSQKIIGLAIFESSSKPILTIIESHGGIGNSAERTANENKRLVDYCLSQNINYIAIDFSNNGIQSDQPENEVLFSDRVKDLQSVMDFVNGTYQSKILLYGSSLGGHITLNAAKDSNGIQGIILNCPALKAFENVRDTMEKQQFDNWENSGFADYDFVHVNSLPYSFFQDLKSQVAMDIIPDLRIPILIFQGTADKVTPVENARKAKELNRNIELVEIPGGGHRFGDIMSSNDYFNKVSEFVGKIISSQTL